MRFAKLTPAQVGIVQPAPWIIADDRTRGPGSRFLAEGWPGFEQIVRNTAYLNGQFTNNEGMANRDISFTLIVDHEFADESDCFLFVCRLGLDCPSGGLLEMGTFGTGGAQVAFPNAVIKSVTPMEVTVVSVKLRYEIMAGYPGSTTEN